MIIYTRPIIRAGRTVLLGLIVTAASLLTPPLFASGVGETAPVCELSDLESGERRTIDELRGKVVYVDFWASWCPPCAKSFPFMNDLQHQFREQGLEILGVNLDEKINDAQEFLSNTPARFDILTDADQQCAKAFDVKAMPSSYLIGRNGVIEHVHLGFRPGDADQLRTQIKELLGAIGATQP